MPTVSELARELNVSVQTIYKKINKSMKKELSEHIKELNGQKVIDEQGKNILKSSFKPSRNGSEPGLNQIKLDNENIPINAGNNGLSEFEPNSNGSELTALIKENSSLKEQIEILKASNNAVESVLNQLKAVQNDETLFLREQNKELQSELKNEREHSRNISEKLAELTRNSQILLKQEQEKNTLLLSESTTETEQARSSEPTEQNHKTKKRQLWQFWKNK